MCLKNSEVSSVTEASPTLYQLDMDGTSLNAFSTDLIAADKWNYSWLPITWTFKGNWKKFKLLGDRSK